MEASPWENHPTKCVIFQSSSKLHPIALQGLPSNCCWKEWFLHGWLVVWTQLKNMKVNWDDHSQIFPIYWKIKFMFQTTNQTVYPLVYNFQDSYNTLMAQKYIVPWRNSSMIHLSKKRDSNSQPLFNHLSGYPPVNWPFDVVKSTISRCLPWGKHGFTTSFHYLFPQGVTPPASPYLGWRWHPKSVLEHLCLSQIGFPYFEGISTEYLWNIYGISMRLTYPSEKYESQLGWWNSQYMEK